MVPTGTRLSVDSLNPLVRVLSLDRFDAPKLCLSLDRFGRLSNNEFPGPPVMPAAI